MEANTLIQYLLSKDKNVVLKRHNFYHNDDTPPDLLSPVCKRFLGGIVFITDLIHNFITRYNNLVNFFRFYLVCFSIFRILYMLIEMFIIIYYSDSPSTYRGHCYKYITSNRLKRFARLLGCLPMVVINGCLLYGITMNNTHMVASWWIVYSVFAYLQFCYGFCAVVLGPGTLQIRSILHFLKIVFNIGVGVCLLNTFEHHYIVNQCQSIFCQ